MIAFECCKGDRGRWDEATSKWIPCQECKGRCGGCGAPSTNWDFCDRCDGWADWNATGGY